MLWQKGNRSFSEFYNWIFVSIGDRTREPKARGLMYKTTSYAALHCLLFYFSWRSCMFLRLKTKINKTIYICDSEKTIQYGLRKLSSKLNSLLIINTLLMKKKMRISNSISCFFLLLLFNIFSIDPLKVFNTRKNT